MVRRPVIQPKRSSPFATTVVQYRRALWMRFARCVQQRNCVTQTAQFSGKIVRLPVSHLAETDPQLILPDVAPFLAGGHLFHEAMGFT